MPALAVRVRSEVLQPNERAAPPAAVREPFYLSLHVAEKRLQQSRLLLVLQRVQGAEVVHHGLVLLLPRRVDVLHHLRPHLRQTEGARPHQRVLLLSQGRELL